MFSKAAKSEVCWSAAVFFVAVSLISLCSVSAAEKTPEYWLEQVRMDIRVNTDSSFLVRESRTYSFLGTFHVMRTVLPLAGLGAVTDIQVYDGEDGKPLTQSSRMRNITDSSAWGKYAYYRSNGNLHIEWYFDATDTVHNWIIEYTVHGGLISSGGTDELRWNINNGHDVPVRLTQSQLTLPENNFSTSDLDAQIYSTIDVEGYVIDRRTFYFQARNVPASTNVFMTASWPKGLFAEGEIIADFLYRA